MGALPSKEIIVSVMTGEFRKWGFNPSIQLILHGEDGETSETITVKPKFQPQFHRGQLDTFSLNVQQMGTLTRQSRISYIELWKDEHLGSSSWLVDVVSVGCVAQNVMYSFPIFRWLKKGHHYKIAHLDTSLPQLDMFVQERREELKDKQRLYEYDDKMHDGPLMTKKVPDGEKFLWEYELTLMKRRLTSKVAGRASMITSGKWTSVEDICNMYNEVHPQPKCVDHWREDSHFGMQRVAGVNNSVIKLVTSSIPGKFPVTDELVGPLLEGLTIQQAIDQKKLFICDLEILKGVETREDAVLCAPIGLFFLNKDNDVMPVAIQLNQDRGPHNPVFTPQDPPHLWTLVKMWYNNADAAHHQASTHLGCTHLMMEGCCIATNRHLSTSHPVYKLLAPHFLYLIAINNLALDLLISKNGAVAKLMSYGHEGIIEVATKAVEAWRLNVEGDLMADLKNRGLDDLSVLPCYHFRDDALLLYEAIKKYVKAYVELYYTSEELLVGDIEIQNWVRELVEERDEEEGVGLLGVPGGGKLTSLDQLTTILTSLIYTCSVAHAAANFAQYDNYGFPPNYPTILKGVPPSSKVMEVTEDDLLQALPGKQTFFTCLVTFTLLSTKATQSLGDFEVQYIFDPRAIALVQQFRNDLKEISKTIKERNVSRKYPYEYLDPTGIPNAISV